MARIEIVEAIGRDVAMGDARGNPATDRAGLAALTRRHLSDDAPGPARS